MEKPTIEEILLAMYQASVIDWDKQTAILPDEALAQATLAINSYIKGLVEEQQKDLVAVLNKMIDHANYIQCPQNCQGGAVQISEDEIQQCQWCAEIEEAKMVLDAITSKLEEGR